jgi:AcrR family transcriptional regulator
MAARDPETTRRRILDAALEEFSEKGIAGARVDDIAGRAGVNKRMLYHYFGSKLGLFEESLRQRLTRPPLLDDADDGPLGEGLAAAHLDLLEQREYVRLLMWEALERGDEDVVSGEDRAEFYAGLVDRVRARQEAGALDPDLDPAQLALTLVAQLVFPIAFPQVTRLVLGVGPDDEGFAGSRAAFLRQLGL